MTFHDQILEHRLVSVTSGNYQTAGRRMARDVRRLGFGAADFRIGNIDGRSHFCDPGENVHEPLHRICGVDSPEGKSLGGVWLHTVKHRGYKPFQELLLAQRRQLRSKAHADAMDQLIHCASDRREKIRYPEFLAHGWQIGRGPMESQCRVVPARIKGPGKRGDRDQAEAVMALEAAYQSQLWSKLWSLELDSIR